MSHQQVVGLFQGGNCLLAQTVGKWSKNSSNESPAAR